MSSILTSVISDLVLCAPQFTNPLREREIKLRAYKIPAIENLGATQDQFDTIDLSDNEIRKLENFPLLRRVKTLLLSNYLIFRIGEDLKDSLPALHTLMLANNNILNLQDLIPLSNLSKLERLVLIENNVTKQPNYRLFVINLLPKLLVLDFKKVKPKVLTPISSALSERHGVSIFRLRSAKRPKSFLRVVMHRRLKT